MSESAMCFIQTPNSAKRLQQLSCLGPIRQQRLLSPLQTNAFYSMIRSITTLSAALLFSISAASAGSRTFREYEPPTQASGGKDIRCTFRWPFTKDKGGILTSVFSCARSSQVGNSLAVDCTVFQVSERYKSFRTKRMEWSEWFTPDGLFKDVASAVCGFN